MVFILLMTNIANIPVSILQYDLVLFEVSCQKFYKEISRRVFEYQ